MKAWTTAAVVAMMTAAATTASQRVVHVPAGAEVRVCVASVSDDSVMFQAKGIASDLFATANVAIVWRSWNRCAGEGIRISLSERSTPLDHPGAMAYALPYEGTHIVLF